MQDVTTCALKKQKKQLNSIKLIDNANYFC